jgi:hypothetical protein
MSIREPTSNDLAMDLAALYLSLTKSKTIPRQRLRGAICRAHAAEAQRDALVAACEAALAFVNEIDPGVLAELLDGRDTLPRDLQAALAAARKEP